MCIPPTSNSVQLAGVVRAVVTLFGCFWPTAKCRNSVGKVCTGRFPCVHLCQAVASWMHQVGLIVGPQGTWMVLKDGLNTAVFTQMSSESLSSTEKADFIRDCSLTYFLKHDIVGFLERQEAWATAGEMGIILYSCIFLGTYINIFVSPFSTLVKQIPSQHMAKVTQLPFPWGIRNTFYVKALTLQELPTHVLCTNDMSVQKISGHLSDTAFTFSKRERELETFSLTVGILYILNSPA